MTTSGSDLVKRLRETPIHYGLLKLIHHEFGNGLAVLSGYRHLLHHEISALTTEDNWQLLKEHWLGYLQTMQERETRLNNLLVQLRTLSPGTIDEPLCQNLVRIDLTLLLRQVIEHRLPLCPGCDLHVSIPAQPLFVMGDPFWMQMLFEHVFFNYMVNAHADTQPASLCLESFSGFMGREAKIVLRIGSDTLGLTTGTEGEFEALIQELEGKELEACLTLCHAILHEHRGRIWSEREGSISLAFPLVE